MSYTCIDIADALPLMEGEAQVVDIRDNVSFQSGHMIGAVHLTNDNVEEFIRDGKLDTPLIVCCYHGNSSKNAADYLASRGFKEVYSLNGGFSQWIAMYPDQCEQS